MRKVSWKIFLFKFILGFSCCSEQPLAEFYSLPCRHQHCLSCWQGYLQSSVFHSGTGRPVYCPSRCNQIIDDEQILKLLINDTNLHERYQRYLVDIFVETNRLTNWCPGNGCTTIVKIKTYSTSCAHLIECDQCQSIRLAITNVSISGWIL